MTDYDALLREVERTRKNDAREGGETTVSAWARAQNETIAAARRDLATLSAAVEWVTHTQHDRRILRHLVAALDGVMVSQRLAMGPDFAETLERVDRTDAELVTKLDAIRDTLSPDEDR